MLGLKVTTLHMAKGACVAKRACMAKGGVCMAKGGHAWYAPPPPRDTASHCAGGTHPTGMHSCFCQWFFKFLIVMLLQ